jgi:hypothetical protein
VVAGAAMTAWSEPIAEINLELPHDALCRRGKNNNKSIGRIIHSLRRRGHTFRLLRLDTNLFFERNRKLVASWVKVGRKAGDVGVVIGIVD